MNAIFRKLTGGKVTPSKSRVWFYQFPNEVVKKIFKRYNRWYYYAGGTNIGCDTLAAAKGDFRYGGAKVWSELK